jgi:hypothetical protein
MCRGRIGATSLVDARLVSEHVMAIVAAYLELFEDVAPPAPEAQGGILIFFVGALTVHDPGTGSNRCFAANQREKLWWQETGIESAVARYKLITKSPH